MRSIERNKNQRNIKIINNLEKSRTKERPQVEDNGVQKDKVGTVEQGELFYSKQLEEEWPIATEEHRDTNLGNPGLNEVEEEPLVIEKGEIQANGSKKVEPSKANMD